MAVGLRRDDTGGRSCVLVLGIIMVICACMWLMWNEREYANTYNMLVETQSECTPLPSSEIVNPILNEKLIYITGKLGTSGPVYDNQFNVSGDFVKLKRNVEMYQWIEEKEKGYHYKKDWRSEVMNSNLFYDPDDHHNPGFLPLTDMEWTADISTIGSYELSNDAVAKISNFRHLHLTPKENVYGDTVYAGDRLKPKVGDIRVSYKYAGRAVKGKEDVVTVVARQSPGPVLTPFYTADGHGILFVYQESLGFEDVFNRQYYSNRIKTWQHRLYAFLLNVLGCFLCRFWWVPSIIDGFRISTLIVIITWLWYQPLYGIPAFLIFILIKVCCS